MRIGSVFTRNQKAHLLQIPEVTGVGGTTRRNVYVTKNTPEIREKVEQVVGSKRYTIVETEEFEAQEVANDPGEKAKAG